MTESNGKRLGFSEIEGLEARLAMTTHIPGLFGDATQLVDDINIAPGKAEIRSAAQLGDKLYFTLVDGVSDVELWSTDGTQNELVAEVDADTTAGCCDLHVVGDTLYFSADYLRHQYDKPPGSNRPPSGYTKLLAFQEGQSGLREVASFGFWDEYGNETVSHIDEVFLATRAWGFNNGSNGLWMRTEGNSFERYEQFVATFRLGISELTQLDGNWYFLGTQHGSHKSLHGLWRTNPTTEQVDLLTEVNSDALTGRTARNLVVSAGDLYWFDRSEASYATELWRYDLATDDAIRVKEFTTAESLTPTESGDLLFIAEDDDFERVWITDGTEAGTMSLAAEDERSQWRSYRVQQLGDHEAEARLMMPLDLDELTSEVSLEESSHLTQSGDLYFFGHNGKLWVANTITNAAVQLDGSTRPVGVYDGRTVMLSGTEIFLLDADTLAVQPFTTAESSANRGLRPFSLKPIDNGIVMEYQRLGVSSTWINYAENEANGTTRIESISDEYQAANISQVAAELLPDANNSQVIHAEKIDGRIHVLRNFGGNAEFWGGDDRGDNARRVAVAPVMAKGGTHNALGVLEP